MNRSLTSNDFELVLDYQSGDCPAVVKERLFETSPDQMPIDFAQIQDKYCWVISHHDAYLWIFGPQSEAAKTRLVHLRLPPSGLVYSSRLLTVFEYGAKTKSTAAVAVSREGVTRFWSTISRDVYVDSVLDINREVAMSIHLLEVSATGMQFILVTTSGSVYHLSGNPSGQIAAQRVGARETQGLAGRLSSFIFGTGSSNTENAQIVNSILHWRESETIEDFDEESQDAVAIVVAANSISSYDVANKSELWMVDAQNLFGEQALEHFNNDATDLSISILDAQNFRKGIIVLVAATRSSSDIVSFFLATLDEIDYQIPKVTSFAEVPLNEKIQALYDAFDESSYVGQVHLSIPKETALSGNFKNTDGVLIVHPVYVQSAYVPEDSTEEQQVSFNKGVILSTNDQIIGYGSDRKLGYIILSDGRIASIRLLPKGFAENSNTDDISIFHVIANMNRPLHDEVQGIIYDSFVAFCDKNMTEALALIQPQLERMAPQELLSTVVTFAWNTIEDMDEDCDFEVEVREKKKFFEYFLLFLKHIEALNKIYAAKCSNPRLECPMKGTEMLAEIGERLQVILSLNQWSNASPDHHDVLQHACREVCREARYTGNDKDLKVALLHLIPRNVVKICKSLIESSAFKNAAQRYDTLCLAADMLNVFSVGVVTSRRTRSCIPINLTNIKWTTALSEFYTEMSLLLLDEIKESCYGELERSKFREYAAKLVSFQLGESVRKIDGHPVLVGLDKVGDEKAAIELAERFKDFKTICRIVLQHEKEQRTKELEGYKIRFASDDFETYLYNYMNRKHLYDELLEQTGARADQFIADLDHIRWRRELQQAKYAEASKTLLIESERETRDIKKQKVLTSLCKLAYFCQEEDEMAQEDFDEIDLNQRVAEYQSTIPITLIKTMYPDNPSRPLTPKELIEICKMRLDEESAGFEEHKEAVLFVARLLKWMPDSVEYQDALVHIWVSVIGCDNWDNLSREEMKNTQFHALLQWLCEDEQEMAPYGLPDINRLVRASAQERLNCPDSSVFLKVSIHDAMKDLNGGMDTN